MKKYRVIRGAYGMGLGVNIEANSAREAVERDTQKEIQALRARGVMFTDKDPLLPVTKVYEMTEVNPVEWQ